MHISVFLIVFVIHCLASALLFMTILGKLASVMIMRWLLSYNASKFRTVKEYVVKAYRSSDITVVSRSLAIAINKWDALGNEHPMWWQEILFELASDEVNAWRAQLYSAWTTANTARMAEAVHHAQAILRVREQLQTNGNNWECYIPDDAVYWPFDTSSVRKYAELFDEYALALPGNISVAVICVTMIIIWWQIIARIV